MFYVTLCIFSSTMYIGLSMHDTDNTLSGDYTVLRNILSLCIGVLGIKCLRCCGIYKHCVGECILVILCTKIIIRNYRLHY